MTPLEQRVFHEDVVGLGDSAAANVQRIMATLSSQDDAIIDALEHHRERRRQRRVRCAAAVVVVVALRRVVCLRDV